MRVVAFFKRPELWPAVALSIDNLVVGFALGVFHIAIAVAAVPRLLLTLHLACLAALVDGPCPTMAVVSVAMSLLGLELGSRVGSTVGERSEEIGGVVLILVGIAIAAGLI